MTNAVKTAPVLTFITCLLSGCGPEKEVYNFPGGFQVEAYWEATGFMDAGTVFEVYQLSDGFFSFKKRIGYAVNWETD